MLEGKVVRIGTHSEGTFTIESNLNGEEIICHFNNKERDWNKIYSYLNKPICLRGSIMVMGHFMVLEIIE